MAKTHYIKVFFKALFYPCTCMRACTFMHMHAVCMLSCTFMHVHARACFHARSCTCMHVHECIQWKFKRLECGNMCFTERFVLLKCPEECRVHACVCACNFFLQYLQLRPENHKIKVFWKLYFIHAHVHMCMHVHACIHLDIFSNFVCIFVDPHVKCMHVHACAWCHARACRFVCRVHARFWHLKLRTKSENKIKRHARACTSMQGCMHVHAHACHHARWCVKVHARACTSMQGCIRVHARYRLKKNFNIPHFWQNLTCLSQVFLMIFGRFFYEISCL